MKNERPRQVYNPFLPLYEYIPDGEPHVFGDRIYLFGSHDREGGDEYCILDYVGYSAPLNDLTDWRYEGLLYDAKQDPDWSAKIGKMYMYAPDVVRGNDGRYYLYYNLEGGDSAWQGIRVAVCDNPVGKYEYYGFVRNADGSPFRRFLPGDPALINDSGVIRLYFGWSLSSVAAKAHLGKEVEIPEQYKKFRVPQSDPKEAMIQAQMMLFKRSREEVTGEPEGIMGANTVVLADDMLTVVGDPMRIVPGDFASEGTGFEGHAFYEASSIRKINGLYYFIYSSMQSCELCYATSRYPDRDFVYGGIIVSNGDVGYKGRKPEDRLNMTANNHGSLECINGKWYVFYHRHTHNSTYSRQACAEPVTILQDGSIPQVEVTSCGLNGGPLRAEGEYPAPIACNITNGRMPHATNRIVGADIPFITHGYDTTRGGSERYITNIKNGTLIGFKYFAFDGPIQLALTARGSGGTFAVSDGENELGIIQISPGNNWAKHKLTIDKKGTYPLYLTYHGDKWIELLSLCFTTV